MKKEVIKIAVTDELLNIINLYKHPIITSGFAMELELPLWNEKDQKNKKVPINPHTLRGASSTNLDTWASYDEVINNIGKAGTAAGDRVSDFYSQMVTSVSTLIM